MKIKLNILLASKFLLLFLFFFIGLSFSLKPVYANQTPFIYPTSVSNINQWNDPDNVLANDGNLATSSATTFTASVLGIHFDFSQLLPPDVTHLSMVFKINAKHKLDIFQWKNNYLYYLYNVINPNDGQLQVGLHDFGINLSTFTYPALTPINGSYPNATIRYFTYDELISGSGNATFIISDFCDYGWQAVCNSTTRASIDSIQASVQYDEAVTSTPTPAPTVITTPTATPVITVALSPTPTPTSKLPVILIPGIMGSEFSVNQTFDPKINDCLNQEYLYNQGDLIWVDTSLNGLAKLECGNYLDVLKLRDDGQTALHSQIELKGTVTNIIYDDGQKSTLTYLQQHGYSLGTNLFVFPFDWRKDIDSQMGKLDSSVSAILNQTHATKVQILAHSMGGLVARDYISNATRAQNVDTLVELGTPHAGVPDAIATLLYPTCLHWLLEPINCAINQKEISSLVQNFTGVYELIPSKLYYQFYPNLYPFNDGRDIDNNGETGALNYEQLQTMLSNLGKNKNALNQADSFHSVLDLNNANINGVKTYFLVGSGIPTIGQIIDYVWSQSGLIKHDAIAIDGDGTVPVKSATLNNTNNVFYSNEDHIGLVRSGSALTMAVNLLNGQTDLISGIQSTPFSFSGKIISIHSPTQLDAYDDQNHHTGKNTNGAYEEQIPESRYYEIGDAKFIYLPDGGHYHITTKAIGDGTFDLKLKTYENSVESREILYLNVPQTINTTSSMILNADTPFLSVDANGDGNNIQELLPTSILSGDALTDTQAPTTTIQKSGTQGAGDWYTSDVSLSFVSDDVGGAGVLKTYYYKDGEQTLHDAEDPITIDTEGETKVWYFSVDKAGNSEQLKSITIRIDKTAPIITYTGRTEVNSKGWNKSDVAVNWICDDKTSGAIDTLISKIITTEEKDQTVTGICTDKAGNMSTDTQSGINIDKTVPTILITTPQKDASYIINSAVDANWSTTDSLSGIDINNGTVSSGSAIDTSKIGSHSFTVNATDNAGNTNNMTITYKVIYRFDGFLQPINDTGHTQTCGLNCTVSTFKGGSTIPAKFQLKDAGGNVIQSATPPQWITPQQGNSITDAIDEAVYTDTPDSGTTYNWDADQYHYNWKTKDVALGYHWLIGVKLDDGQTYTVNIGLR